MIQKLNNCLEVNSHYFEYLINVECVVLPMGSTSYALSKSLNAIEFNKRSLSMAMPKRIICNASFNSSCI